MSTNHATAFKAFCCKAVRAGWAVFITSLFLVGVSPGIARAEDDEDDKIRERIQEFFVGEIVYPQDAGEVQLTTGFSHWNEGSERFTAPLGFEYGITDRFQVGAELPVTSRRTEDGVLEGIGRVELETLYNLVNRPDWGTAVSVGFGLGFPTARNRFEEEAYRYEPFFAFYQELGPSFLNVSAALELDDTISNGQKDEAGGEIALGIGLELGHFVPTLESVLELEEGGTTSVQLLPGFHWILGGPLEGLEIALGYSMGIDKDAPERGVLSLLTFKFGGD